MVRPGRSDPPAREKILRVACELFYRQGYHQTGTNQLIREAGVSKATFYAHFPTKEALAVEYVRESATRSMEMLRDGLAGIEDPLERFLYFRRSIEAHLIDTGYRGCHFSNIAREFPDQRTPVRAEVIAFENAYRKLLWETVATLEAAEPKRFRKSGLSVDEVTDRYYLLLEGAINSSANYHDAWPLKAVEPAIRDLVAA